MDKTESLKCNGLFLKLYRTGETITGRYLVLYFKKNKLNKNRLGITVSKKVGKAVVRNYVRRLIREVYRLNEYRIASGYDIIFVSRVRCGEADFHTVRKEMLSHLGRCGLLEESYEENSDTVN